ncbi:InlB B-repeat-containing protein, partial [Alkalibacter saccharofermentans]
MRSANKQLFSVVMLIFSIILITGCTFLINSEGSDESTLIINESGSYTLSDNYKVVKIEVGDVVIEDGNAEKIVIEQTVGDGEVTLKNINAQKLYVFGGGVNSVLLQEKTRINEIKVKREDGHVRIVIEDESIANNVTVAQGSQNVIIQGNIDILKVEASDVEVTADKGHIRKAIIENSNSSIIVGKDSKLDEGNISEETSGSKFVILGSGDLLEVSGKGNIVEVDGFLKKLIVTQKTDIVVNSNIDEVIFKDDAEESILIINAEGVVKLIRSNTKININGTGYVEKAVAIATKQVAGNSVIKTITLQDNPFIDMNYLKEENLKTITNIVPKVNEDDNNKEVQDKELYKVKFIDFDSTLLKIIDVEKNGSAIPPKNPSRIGYSFKGWDKAFDNVTEDMDVFAYYKANEYIIAFNENGGSKIGAIKSEFEKTIPIPEDPNKEGYVVEGWYKNAALTEKWNFRKDTVPLNGLTLYAKWIVEDYSINYELNGGKNHFDAPTSYNIESEAISLKAPEKEGYMFVGWFDKNEGGNLCNEIAKGSVGDKVVYARWQAKSDTGYKINHYKQNANGEGYSLVETETYQGVTDSSVESKARSYDGFELNVNVDGTLVKGTIKGDGSLAMKLYYDRIQYKVAFRDYDDSILKSEMVMYESDAKPPKAERSGYTFIGWSGTFNNVKSDITIKAVYEVNTDTAYKVEHYKQDVDGVGYTLAETENLAGTTDTVATATDKGYVGFTFDKDIEGTVQSGNVEGDGSLVLKLYYDRNEYSVVFKDYDGTVLKTESVLYEGDAAAPVAARTGYVFD